MSALSFSDQTDCCQTIGKVLAAAVREKWQNITVEVQLSGIEVTLIKHYKNEHGISKDVPFIPILGECFYALARLVSTEQKGYFKSCTFVLEPNGEFNTQFVY